MSKFWTVEINNSDIIKGINSSSIYQYYSKDFINFSDVNFSVNSLIIVDYDPLKKGLDELIVVSRNDQLAKQLSKLIAIPSFPSPVSGLIRFWNVLAAERFFSRSENVNYKILLPGFSGLVSAEIFVKFGRNSDLNIASINVASRLFSYSCAKLFFDGGSDEELFELAQAWTEASLVTGNDFDIKLCLTLGYLANFINSYSKEFDHYDNLNSLSIFISGIQPVDSDLFDTRNLLDLREAENVIKSTTRENRIQAVEKFISLIHSKYSDNLQYRDLVCGYLIALIDPGSLDFFDLAMKINKGDPSVALAYATCSSLMAGEHFGMMNSGFGRSILSRLKRERGSVFDSNPDLGLDELKILSRLNVKNYSPFRTQAGSAIDVELIPGITGSFLNIAKKEASIKPTIEQDAIPKEKIYQPIKLLEKSISNIQKNLDELMASIGMENLPTDKRKSTTSTRSRKK